MFWSSAKSVLGRICSLDGFGKGDVITILPTGKRFDDCPRQEQYECEFSPEAARYRLHHAGFLVETELWVPPSEPFAVMTVTVTNESPEKSTPQRRRTQGGNRTLGNRGPSRAGSSRLRRNRPTKRAPRPSSAAAQSNMKPTTTGPNCLMACGSATPMASSRPPTAWMSKTSELQP